MKTSKQLTLGSLFDGIGGFPLAGKYAGIRPVWASEIEPFPIRVTEKRLPEMKHYGDIHGLHGAKLEPVDVITFGSPCQDVSIAGRREGLSGGRSGLFFEAIRIIREMREATNGEYPKWAVWENVPGALSSHNGGGLPASPRKPHPRPGTRSRCSSACGRTLAAGRGDHGRRLFSRLAHPRRRAGLGRRTKTETCICCPRFCRRTRRRSTV